MRPIPIPRSSANAGSPNRKLTTAEVLQLAAFRELVRPEDKPTDRWDFCLEDSDDYGYGRTLLVYPAPVAGRLHPRGAFLLSEAEVKSLWIRNLRWPDAVKHRLRQVSSEKIKELKVESQEDKWQQHTG